MRALAVVVGLAALVAGCSSEDAQGTDRPRDAGSLEGGVFGGARPVHLRVPAGYDGTKALPLVLLLHGYGVSGLVQDIIFHVSDYADQGGYFFAAPDGTVDKSGSHFWNATDDCCDFDGSGVDDVGYLTGLIHEMESAYVIDPRRVYVVGHSNGGYMAHRLACDDAPDLAAIVSVAGATWKDQTKCQPTRPVNVLEIHGDADKEVLYAGGVDGAHAYPGAVETVTDWAVKNGCDPSPQPVNPPLDLDSSLAGAETLVSQFPKCQKGGDVALWTIQGGGHVPNWTPDFPAILWSYFAAHPKP